MLQKYLLSHTIEFTGKHEKNLVFRDVDNYRGIDHQENLFKEMHNDLKKSHDDLIERIRTSTNSIMMEISGIPGAVWSSDRNGQPITLTTGEVTVERDEVVEAYI